MKQFEFIKPASLSEAIVAAGHPGSSYLAAGTNLLDLMKLGVGRPDRVIDITHLPDLNNIEWSSQGEVRIGALVRNSDLAYDDRFQRTFPAAAEALLSGASAQLRNAATVGGNLLQRTRCAYFQDLASACNRRNPGSGCDAIGGENRLYAVLGWSEHCIATHPSDFCVALSALDAIVETEGPDGRREFALDALHLLPGETPERENALMPGELIVALRIPAAAASVSGHSRHLKVRERTSFAFAVVSVAVGLELENGLIRTARLALGGVAAKPWRAHSAEVALQGAAATEETFAMAATIALAEAVPSGDNGFKIELARRLVIRALQHALEGTPTVMPALPGSVFAQNSGATHVA